MTVVFQSFGFVLFLAGLGCLLMSVDWRSRRVEDPEPDEDYFSEN